MRLTSFGGFVFLFTDVILTVQNATRFFRASSEADCVTFVAGLMLTKDDDPPALILAADRRIALYIPWLMFHVNFFSFHLSNTIYSRSLSNF